MCPWPSPALFFPLATELNELGIHRRDAKGQQWFQNKLDEATYIHCSSHKSPRHNASKYVLGSTSGTQPLDGRDSRAKTLTRSLQVCQRQILPGVMGFGGFQLCSPTRSLWPCFLLVSQCHYGFTKRFWTQDRNRLHKCRVTMTWLLSLILILMLVDRVVAVEFVSMDLRMNKCSKNWGPVGKGTKIRKSHQNIKLKSTYSVSIACPCVVLCGIFLYPSKKKVCQRVVPWFDPKWSAKDFRLQFKIIEAY